MNRRSLLFLPSAISLSRLVLAAVFISTSSATVRVALVVVAAFTDFLDGWLARHANLTTKWGALIDPIADRIFVFTAVCIFLFEGAIGTPQYFALISRDIMTAIGFLVARAVSWLRPVAFRARLSGKIVTTLQLASLVAVLMRQNASDVLIKMVGVTSVWAVIDYTLMLWRERDRTVG